MRLSRWWSLGALAAFAALTTVGLTGCGGGKADISGKVTYKGSPLKGGTVTFYSTQGKVTISGPIQQDGSYVLPSVPKGHVKILVETKSMAPAMAGSGPGPGGMGGMKPPGAGGGIAPPTYAAPSGGGGTGYTPPANQNNASRYVEIPASYADEKTTKLEYDVKGNDTKDIALD